MYTTNAQPTAEICFKKSRLKKYQGNKLYLKNNQEFEIELFNPTTDDILAKISLDNKELSGGGIVLRPGERVFLDRYLDKAQKFKFSTYEVGNSAAVQNAIRDNGKVKVTFHKESIPYTSPIWTNSSPWGWNQGTPWNGNGVFYCSTGGNPVIGTTTSSSSFTCSTSMNFSESLEDKSDKKETGRIEAGSHSDQSFVSIDKSFDYWAFATLEYQILPESVKTYTSADLRTYCSQCGKKSKNGDKFCPSCGNKL